MFFNIYNNDYNEKCCSIILKLFTLIYQVLEEELVNRSKQVKELEQMPEIHSLAKKLSDALLDTVSRLRLTQQVHIHQHSGAFALYTVHLATVMGFA